MSRKKGRLSILPSLPLDILYEVSDERSSSLNWAYVSRQILGHLPPHSLLRVAHVNKAFYRLLMSKKSRFLWIEVLKSVPDLPQCPEDLSEPAHVTILFGYPVCYVGRFSGTVTALAHLISAVIPKLPPRSSISSVSVYVIDAYESGKPTSRLTTNKIHVAIESFGTVRSSTAYVTACTSKWECA